MARPKTKEELIQAAESNFDRLRQMMDSMSKDALNTDFDFSGDAKRKEAHWKRDKNLRDVLIHLYEWHRLLLKWVESNSAGHRSPFIPEPYNWSTYGEMNREFWKKHQKTSLKKSKELFNKSHRDVLALLCRFSDQELFSRQAYDWTGTTTLGSYCVSATSSHYEWAIKKLRLHMKKFSK